MCDLGGECEDLKAGIKNSRPGYIGYYFEAGAAGAAGAEDFAGAVAGAAGMTALFFGVILSTTEALFCEV